MKMINTLKGYIVSLCRSLKRFPIAIGLSTLATILLIVLTQNEQYFSSDIQEQIGRIVMVIALGIPVSLCLKLIFERRAAVSPFVRAAVYLIAASCLVLYYFILLKDFTMVEVTRYIGLSLSLYLAFIFIPYFFRRSDFELYVIKLLTRAFTTIVYSVVLYLGLSAILFTIDSLLGIRIESEIYIDVWLGVVGVFATSFFLTGVPLYEEQYEISTYPKLLKVLLLYIVMPIISIYTAILYAYFVKIIATLQWPVGMVTHLVLWYSVICTAVFFLSSPLADENKWARSFISLLPKLIIPLAIMMLFSIGIRIEAYGITENRYFVTILGLWALGIMIYLSLAKTKRNIIMLVSLSLIVILSVVGPWSSYSISKLSQNQRLEGILQKYDMLRDNSIVKSGQVVSEADQKEISEILSYFSMSHTLNDVKVLPKGFEMKEMKDVFGFSSVEYGINNNRKYFAYSSNINSPIDIKGYSYMLLRNNANTSDILLDKDIIIGYDSKSYEVIVYKGGKEIYRSSLEDFAKQIHSKYGTSNNYNIDPDDMILADENANIKVKLKINYINGVEIYDEISELSFDFYMLIDVK